MSFASDLHARYFTLLTMNIHGPPQNLLKYSHFLLLLAMPTDPQLPSPPPLILTPTVFRDSRNLSQLGSAISGGSIALISEALPTVHWTENDRRTAGFWSSFPQRMLELLKSGAQSEPRHAQICATLIGDAEFSAAFRAFLFSRKNPLFFLGHGSLTLQLDGFRGVDTPAARRQICGVACDWACSAYFESEQISLFDHWPIAQWLSPPQKLGVAQGWLESLERADAVANRGKQTPSWLAKRAAAETLLNAGWTEAWCLREIVDALLLGERPNGPREWKNALAATDACLFALGEQAPASPYWDLWAEAIEDMAKTAPKNLDTDVEWRAFFGKLKAQNEATQLRSALTIRSLPSVAAPVPHAREPDEPDRPATAALANPRRI